MSGYLEAPTNSIVPSEEVTAQYPDLAAHLRTLVDEIAGTGSAPAIHLYRPKETRMDHHPQHAPELDVVIHTTFAVSAPLRQVHLQTEEITHAFRQAHPMLRTITIHPKPSEWAPIQERRF